MTGIQLELARNELSLLLGTASPDVDSHARVGTTMLERGVDGLILVPPVDVDDATIRMLAQQTPVVMCAGHIPNIEIDYVGMDDELGARRAVEHLIKRGHKRIAFIGGNKAATSRRDRLSGYLSMLEKHKIPVDSSLEIEGENSRRGGFEAIQNILQLDDRPTAAFCYNDVTAFGVMLGLRAAGIEPGEEFAIVGFDNVAEASLWQPTLTTISTNPEEMGREVSKLLLRRLANPDKPIEQITYPSTLVQRDSS